MDSIISSIDEMWVGTHGGMRELVVDGERAIAKSWEARDYFTRRGIKVHVRAPEMHARFIERRGALVRDKLLKLDTQLEKEGYKL